MHRIGKNDRAQKPSLVYGRWSLAYYSSLSINPAHTDYAGVQFAFANDQRRTTKDDVYNPFMPLVDQIQKDIIAAMKSREEARLSTLRMVKAALKNREIEKMAPLDDKESQQVLSTLIKQRKDSIEQFTKGGRKEMADKEAAEITLIEAYLPKAASEADIAAGVKAVVAEMGSPTMKDMGTVMKNAMAKFSAQGVRVDGKVVSDLVKKELAGK
jgi:uncharacterized protein